MMSGSWSKGAMMVAAAGALVLGAGVWRQSTLARTAPGPADAPAPNNAVAGSPAVTGAGGKEVKAEFEVMVNGLRQKMRGAKTPEEKQAVAGEILTAFQQFAEKYPKDPTADQARLSLGQLQMRLGKASEAVLTLKEVADHPVDSRMAPVARFYMAQAMAMTGQTDLARQTLEELAKSAPLKEIRQASQQILEKLKSRAAIAPGNKAPSFEGKDLQGQSQSPDRYRGKVLLVDFWATWCGPCRAELPNVKATYEKYKERGFAVLGISLDQDRKALDSFLKSEGLPWPQVFDGKGWQNEIAQSYGVSSIPRTILLDREGVIRTIDARGPALDAAVAELIDRRAGG